MVIHKEQKKYDVRLFFFSTQVAFLIYRPVMRLFKCQGSSDVFWPLDDNETESESRDDFSQVILDLGPPRKPTM